MFKLVKTRKDRVERYERRVIKTEFPARRVFSGGACGIKRVANAQGCASLEYRASGFLARIGLWVRLIFGLGAPRCESVSLAQEDYAASRVQTLNQYRERFARISVLGRVGIYAPPSFGRFAQLILSSRAA